MTKVLFTFHNTMRYYKLIAFCCLVNLYKTNSFVLPTSSASLQFRNQLKKRTRQIYVTLNASKDDAQSLMDEVAKIRAEIAALEGKSVEEVQTEAEIKRVSERERETAQHQQEVIEREQRQKAKLNSTRVAGRLFPLPESVEDQVRQATSAAERAYSDGISRQIIRFALFPYEGGNIIEMSQWPGGAQQMYREAARPFTEDMLRRLRPKRQISMGNNELTRDDLPPKIITQDIWDFDGSALITAESSGGPSNDVQAMVLPNTDSKYTSDIQKADEAMGDRLFLLVNPFWRNLESWGINIMAPNAKKTAEKVIFNRSYEETYILNRLDARGERCAAVKAYPYDWQLYAYIEDEYFPNREVPIWLGSTLEEPKSGDFSRLLNLKPEFKLSKNMRMIQRMRGN